MTNFRIIRTDHEWCICKDGRYLISVTTSQFGDKSSVHFPEYERDGAGSNTAVVGSMNHLPIKYRIYGETVNRWSDDPEDYKKSTEILVNMAKLYEHNPFGCMRSVGVVLEDAQGRVKLCAS